VAQPAPRTDLRILRDLNPRQRAAVTHGDGPLLVFAGAGTGKTRVITHRIAHLVRAREVSPARILAVTFTNKAAREMRERVIPLCGGRDASRGLTVTTFHALCARILRADGHHLGLTEHFSIFGEADQRGLIRAILAEMGPEREAAEVLTAISLAKNRLIPPEAFADPSLGAAREALVKDVYARYQTTLAAMNAVDFDDLLLHTVRLFRKHGHVKVGWQRRFPHVLVDEFQDTNAAQYALLSLLWGGEGSLTVVGDDDQSIYAWRGAEPETFADFTRDYPGCAEVVLEQNYRSTGTILKAAHAIIAEVADRKPKRLWSELGEGRKLGHITAVDADEEARRVVEDLNVTRLARRADLSEFAVLIRTNAQSRAFEAALREAHLPYVVVGATGFFDRAEVRDLTAYLRFLHNDMDEAALRRIVNTPRRGVGSTTLAALATQGRERGLSLFEAMDQAKDIPGVPAAALRPLRAFVDQMAEFRFSFQREDMVETLNRLIDDTGLKAHWVEGADTGPQAEGRLSGAEEFVRMMARYVQRETEPDLPGFLEHLCLLDRMDDDEQTRKGRVTIITLHAAKGLEFPHVFLVGMEEGFLPHARSVEEGREIAEERRLCYVGITRAMKTLTLSYAKNRSRWGEIQKRTPSRFLADIPGDLFVSEDEEPEGTQEELAKGFFDAVKGMLE
jgi:DNA helicase-2/ATP-dependent DNA helicase PcrA